MHIKLTLMFVLLCTVLGAQGCSQGNSAEPAVPQQRQGLWEVTTVDAKPAQTFNAGGYSVNDPASTTSNVLKTCLGKDADKTLRPLAGLGFKECTRKMGYSGSTLTVDAACDLEVFSHKTMHTTMHSVTTFNGDTGFRRVTQGHGANDSTVTVTAKWIGACPAPMLPNDVMGNDGKITRKAADGSYITIDTKAH